MPYKLSSDGKTVLVQRSGKWTPLKRHPTRAKALRHMRALYVNVPEAQTPERNKKT